MIFLPPPGPHKALLTVSTASCCHLDPYHHAQQPLPSLTLNPLVHINTRCSSQKQNSLCSSDLPSLLSSSPSFLCTLCSCHSWSLAISQMTAPLMFYCTSLCLYLQGLSARPTFSFSPRKSHSNFRNLLRCQAPVKPFIASRR